MNKSLEFSDGSLSSIKLPLYSDVYCEVMARVLEDGSINKNNDKLRRAYFPISRGAANLLQCC